MVEHRAVNAVVEGSSPSPPANDLADYIADHYGICDRGSDCYWAKDGCLRGNWLGCGCKHWHPVKATNWEELRNGAFGYE